MKRLGELEAAIDCNTASRGSAGGECSAAVVLVGCRAGRDLPASSPGGAPPAATDGDDELDMSSLVPASFDTVIVLVAGFCVFRATERLCAIATRGRRVRLGGGRAGSRRSEGGGEADRRQRQRRRRAGPLEAQATDYWRERGREGRAGKLSDCGMLLWIQNAIAGFCACRVRCRMARAGSDFSLFEDAHVLPERVVWLQERRESERAGPTGACVGSVEAGAVNHARGQRRAHMPTPTLHST